MSKVSEEAIKPKRGRRSKKEILASLEKEKEKEKEQTLLNENVDENKKIFSSETNIKLQISPEVLEDDVNTNTNENADASNDGENVVVKSPGKKRGRKPKGGKIIQQNLPIIEQKETKPNVILHLKCSMKDLQLSGDYNSNFTSSNIESFAFGAPSNDCFYEIINKPEEDNLIMTPAEIIGSTNISNIETKSNCCFDSQDEDNCETKEIWRKLKILEHNLHINNISDKKSACFWCSYDFDNPPIYIPKHFIKDSYHVYGCFCSPECATAHLMEENIDSSTKFERYYLINHIYSKIYQYSKNIKPAPNPHYMLERYYGNLTIQEYRALLKSERLFLIVDKPLTRILPEFHEDNDDFIINNKIIPSNNYQVKKQLHKKQHNKNNLHTEKTFWNGANK
jgi:hypothetical protein